MNPELKQLVVAGAVKVINLQGGVYSLIVSGTCTAFSLLIETDAAAGGDQSGAYVAFGASTTLAAAGVVNGLYIPTGAYTCTVTGDVTTFASLRAALN